MAGRVAAIPAELGARVERQERLARPLAPEVGLWADEAARATSALAVARRERARLATLARAEATSERALLEAGNGVTRLDAADEWVAVEGAILLTGLAATDPG